MGKDGGRGEGKECWRRPEGDWQGDERAVEECE